MKPIHFHYNDASGSIFFKAKQNDRANTTVIHCSNSENCEVFKRGSCVLMPQFLGYQPCPYGKLERQQGPTRRSRKISEWIAKKQKEFAGVPSLTRPVDKLAFVGDYVYFPYSHATMNEGVPFLSKGGFMRNGDSFMKLEHWTHENIKKIIDFRPYALFGGEITDYQKKYIPLFLMHWEELYPSQFAEFMKVYPGYLTQYGLVSKNYVGRKALLKTISPCEFSSKGSSSGEYRVKWKWDGKTLTTSKESGIYAYESTWGGFERDKIEAMSLSITPNDKMPIVISDNAQVNANTIFVD